MIYSLCCMTHDKGFKTTTYKSYLSTPDHLKNKKIEDIIVYNLEVCLDIIKYCYENKWAYRVSSSMFPLITHPNGPRLILNQCPRIVKALENIKAFLSEYPVHLSSHPDQFNVLESKNQTTIDATIRELNLTAWFFDSIGLPQNYSNPINIHLVCQDDSYENVATRFKENFKKLSVSAQRRLVLENNDKGKWSAIELYDNFADFMPLTFDNLHYEINNPFKHLDVDTQNECKSLVFHSYLETWTSRGFVPHFHYSEGGKDGKIRSHLDYPTKKPETFGYTGEIYFDVELKEKDLAIKQLEK